MSDLAPALRLIARDLHCEDGVATTVILQAADEIERLAAPGVSEKQREAGGWRGDIVHRLRRWTHAVDAVPASDLMDEAADHIWSLRREIRDQRREIAALREERGSLVADDRPKVDRL